jgi:hypothetical protein
MKYNPCHTGISMEATQQVSADTELSAADRLVRCWLEWFAIKGHRRNHQG